MCCKKRAVIFAIFRKSRKVLPAKHLQNTAFFAVAVTKPSDSQKQCENTTHIA
jgi:hypothetical protein